MRARMLLLAKLTNELGVHLGVVHKDANTL